MVATLYAKKWDLRRIATLKIVRFWALYTPLSKLQKVFADWHITKPQCLFTKLPQKSILRTIAIAIDIAILQLLKSR